MAVITRNKNLNTPDNPSAAAFNEKKENLKNNLMTLMDENGKELDFQVLDVFSIEDVRYLVLLDIEKKDPDPQDLLVLRNAGMEENSYEEVDGKEEKEKLLKTFAERVAFGQRLAEKVEDEYKD